MPNKHAPEMHKFLGSNNLILIGPDGYQGRTDTASSNIATLGKIIKNSALFTIITALFLLPALPLSAEDDFIKAVRQLAEAGDGEAQFSLALMYDFGDGMKRDPKQATSWYMKAAKQGVAGAYLNLGMKYEFGNGIGRDVEKAVKWYGKAAKQGWPMAQFFLGILYLGGSEIDADPVQAHAWLTLAADQGYPGAEVRLRKADSDLSKRQRFKVAKLVQSLRREIEEQKGYQLK